MRGKEKGVTLVALVVTIIVLIILASITIGAIKGDGGIINQSKDAKAEVEKQQWEERIDSAIIDAETKYPNPTLDQVIEELIKDGIIDSEDQVDENGTITTNEPVYEIEGKLDDYLDKDTPEEPDPEPDPDPEDPDEPILAEHTVTYDFKTNNGLSAGKTSAKLEEGETVDLSVVSSKAGYEFIGWNTNSNAHEGLTSLKMGTSDITLYAIYKKDIVATFNYWNGSTTEEEQKTGTVYNNETTISITTPAIANANKDGLIYTPRGWSEQNVGNGSIVATSGGNLNVSDSKEYYALYEGSTKVTFYYYSGSGQTSASGTSASTMNSNGEIITSDTIEIPNVVRASSGPNGTLYAGVAENTNIASGETGTTVSASNSVYYAYYSRNITFYYNSGTYSKSYSSTGTKTATTNGSSYSTILTRTPSTTTYNGIDFSHWSSTSGQDYEADPSATSYTTYYAVYDGERNVPFTYWNGYSSSTTYATGGRKYISTTSNIVSTGGEVEIPEEVTNSSGPSGTSYVFVSSSETGTYAETPTADGTMYYAIYSKEITITKMTYNNTPKYQYSSIYGYSTGRTSNEAVTLEADSNLPVGYSFYGWSTSTSAGGSILTNTTIYPTSNATYYAIYKKTVEVSYNLNGGSGDSSTQYVDAKMNYLGSTSGSQNITVHSKPYKVSQAFVYWSTSTGTSYRAEEVINPTENITLNAVWYQMVIPASISAYEGETVHLTLAVNDADDITDIKVYRSNSRSEDGYSISNENNVTLLKQNDSVYRMSITDVNLNQEGYYYFVIKSRTYGDIEIENSDNACFIEISEAENILKSGDWVYYSGWGYQGNCVVLWGESSSYGNQIIPMETVADISIGNGTGGISSNIQDVNTAKSAYNNAISNLNARAYEYYDSKYLKDARCVGSNPQNKNAESGTGEFKDTDTNYLYDVTQMKMLGIYSIGEDYWLASRNVTSSYPGKNYSLYYMSSGASNPSVDTICYSASSSSISYHCTHGLRPVFILRDDIIITGGSGTEYDPYTLGT